LSSSWAIYAGKPLRRSEQNVDSGIVSQAIKQRYNVLVRVMPFGIGEIAQRVSVQRGGAKTKAKSERAFEVIGILPFCRVLDETECKRGAVMSFGLLQ